MLNICNPLLGYGIAAAASDPRCQLDLRQAEFLAPARDHLAEALCGGMFSTLGYGYGLRPRWSFHPVVLSALPTTAVRLSTTAIAAHILATCRTQAFRHVTENRSSRHSAGLLYWTHLAASQFVIGYLVRASHERARRVTCVCLELFATRRTRLW
jgi:hypothetical protein